MLISDGIAYAGLAMAHWKFKIALIATRSWGDHHGQAPVRSSVTAICIGWLRPPHSGANSRRSVSRACRNRGLRGL